MNTTANNTKTTQELTPAGYCLGVYVNNEVAIYDAYTIPAIAAAVSLMTAKGVSEITPADVAEISTAIKSYLDGAIKRAAVLLKVYDNLTPTAADIATVTADLLNYVIEGVQYDLDELTAKTHTA